MGFDDHVSMLHKSVPQKLNVLFRRVGLVHDTRSSDSQSNDARFMHKLYLPLHAHKQTGERIHPITLKGSKILLSNSNWA